MDQNATLLEMHSALNTHAYEDVAAALSAMHPCVLGEMLRAVDKAYHMRTNYPHPDYESALKSISSNRSINVFDSNNKAWRQNEHGEQYCDGTIVCGAIREDEDGLWEWSASVTEHCRMQSRDGTKPPIKGRALTKEGAKRVVELLCEITETLSI